MLGASTKIYLRLLAKSRELAVFMWITMAEG